MWPRSCAWCEAELDSSGLSPSLLGFTWGESSILGLSLLPLVPAVPEGSLEFGLSHGDSPPKQGKGSHDEAKGRTAILR